MKLAVLIPVCNAERYLRECLDSALAEARALRDAGGHDLTLFCCDDGSEDGSLPILREYAAQSGSVRFVAQANAGVSQTRNRLMDELPPEIEAFAFLDSDDFIRPGMYRALVDALVRTGADVAETEWDGEERVVDDMSLYLLKRTAPGRWINVINKLYRRSAVEPIRFRKGLAFEEDFFFNFEVHRAIRRKVLVPGRYYYYRPNPDSATKSLDMRKYFDSTMRRIRLSCEEYLLQGRIPLPLEPEFRRELAKDAYRMCIRKNLKKNRDAASRRELFAAAGKFFRDLQRGGVLSVGGLNPLQRLLFACCLEGRYALARALSALT